MDIRLPDGTVIRGVPDGITQSELALRLQKNGFTVPPEWLEGAQQPKKSGVLNAVVKGIEGLFSSGQTAYEAATGNVTEAARAGAERSKNIGERYVDEVDFGKVKQKYNDPKGGLFPAIGEALRQAPYAVAEQVPQMGVTLGGAKLGAMAGFPIGGPVGSAIGAGIGAFLPSVVQQFAGNIERQVEANPQAEVQTGRALGTAAFQGGLDAGATFFVLGKAFVGKALGPEVAALINKGNVQAAEALAKRSLTRTLVEGAGRGIAAEVPTEIMQEMLERAQAGLPLTSPDALADYGKAGWAAGLAAGALGPAGRVSERSAARTQQEELKAKAQEEARVAEEARKQSPEYAAAIAQQYKDAQAQYDKLMAEVAAVKPQKGVPQSAADAEEYRQKKKAAQDLLDNTLQPLAAEYTRVKGRLTPEQKAEPGQDLQSYLDYVLGNKDVEALRGTPQQQARTNQRVAAAAQEAEQARAQRSAQPASIEDIAGLEIPDAPFRDVTQRAEAARAGALRGVQTPEDFMLQAAGLERSEQDRASTFGVETSAAITAATRALKANDELGRMFVQGAGKLQIPGLSPQENRAVYDEMRDEYARRQRAYEEELQASSSVSDDIPGRGRAVEDPARSKWEQFWEGQYDPPDWADNVDTSPTIPDYKFQDVFGKDEPVPNTPIQQTAKALAGEKTADPLNDAEIRDKDGNVLPTQFIEGRETAPASLTEKELADQLRALLREREAKRRGALVQKRTGYGPAGRGDYVRFDDTEEGLQLRNKIDETLERLRIAQSRPDKRWIRPVVPGSFEAQRENAIDPTIPEGQWEDYTPPYGRVISRVAQKAPDAPQRGPLSRAPASGPSLEEKAQEFNQRLRARPAAPQPGVPTPRPVGPNTLTRKTMAERKAAEAERKKAESLEAERKKQEQARAKRLAGLRKQKATYEKEAKKLPKLLAELKELQKRLDALRNAPKSVTTETGPMKAETVERIAARVEQITKLVIDRRALNGYIEQLNREIVELEKTATAADATVGAARTNTIGAAPGSEKLASLQTLVKANRERTTQAAWLALAKKSLDDLDTELGAVEVELQELDRDIQEARAENKETIQLPRVSEETLDKANKDVGSALARTRDVQERLAKIEKSQKQFEQEERQRQEAQARAEEAEQLRSKLDAKKAEAEQLEKAKTPGEGTRVEAIDEGTRAARERVIETGSSQTPVFNAEEKKKLAAKIRETVKKLRTLEGKLAGVKAKIIAKNAEASVTKLRENFAALDREYQQLEAELVELLRAKKENDAAQSTGLSEEAQKDPSKVKGGVTKKLKAVKRELEALNAEIAAKEEKYTPARKVEARMQKRLDALEEAYKKAFSEQRQALLPRIEKAQNDLRKAQQAVAAGVSLPYLGKAQHMRRKAELEAVKESLENKIELLEEAEKANEALRGPTKTALQTRESAAEAARRKNAEDARIAAERAEADTRKEQIKALEEKLKDPKKGLEAERAVAKARVEYLEETGAPADDIAQAREVLNALPEAPDAEVIKQARQRWGLQLQNLKQKPQTASTVKKLNRRSSTYRGDLGPSGQEVETNKVFSIDGRATPARDWKAETAKYEERRRQALAAAEAAEAAAAEDAAKAAAEVEAALEALVGATDVERAALEEAVNDATALALTAAETSDAITAAVNKEAVARVDAELKKMFPDFADYKQSGKLEVYPTVESAVAAHPELKGLVEPEDGAFVHNGRAYLIARNLPEGAVFSKVLHEVGAHIGMRNAFNASEYKALYNAVKAWMKRDDGSVESVIGKAVAQRLKDAGTKKADVQDETIAYAVEEAVANGILPTAGTGQAKTWLRKVVQSFRRALSAFGLAPKELTPQQLVDMAYGFARLELKGDATVKPDAVGPRDPGTVLFSRGSAKYAKGLDDLRAADERLIAKEPSFFESVKSNLWGLGGRTQFIDSAAPLEKMSEKMDALNGAQMMYYVRMFGQRMNFTNQSAIHGPPELKKIKRKDGRNEWLIEAKEGTSLKDIAQAIKPAADIIGSADAASNSFTRYLAAKRVFGLDSRGKDGLDMLFGRDSGMTRDQLRAQLKRFDELGVTKHFENAARIYNDYNKGLIDFAVDTGFLSRKVANELLSTGDYVPFYRERGGNVELVIGNETPVRIANLKDAPHLKELVGGDERIFDWMTSAVQNTAMLLDVSLRNIATKNAVFELHNIGGAKLGSAKLKGPDVVHFFDDGVEKAAVIDTDKFGVPADLLVKGMAGIPTMVPAVVRMLGVPASILRRAVTLNPLYVARQVVRDSVASTLTTGANLTPIVSTLREMGSGDKTLEKRGVTGGQVFTGDNEDIAKILREMTAGKDWGINSTLARAEALAMEADAATRRTQYKSARDQGLSEMEASLLSLESMNFNKRGLSPSVHLASMLIPFFNAQIQGLDVLYKASRGKMPFNEKLKTREKLMARGLMIAAGTMAYAALMQDDEAYQNADPETKYNNWFVRVPGVDQPVRVPIPFELGYIFKALPEAVYNTMLTDNKQAAQDAKKAWTNIAKQLVPGGTSYGMPQAVKPILEAAFNYNFFGGRPIETAYEQTLLPEARFRENTSELAKTIGSAAGVSPVMIDHLVRGYTASIGLAFVQALGYAWPDEGPEKASKRLSDTPVFGPLFQPNDAQGIVSAVYEKARKVQQIQRTYEDMLKDGNRAEAQAFVQENLKELVQAEVMGNFTAHMRKLTQHEAAIKASSLSAEEKRARLDEVRRLRIKIARNLQAATERT